MEHIKEIITTGVKSNCLATKLLLINELRTVMNGVRVTSQDGINEPFITKTACRDGVRRIVQSVN